ncbi:MAG: hypothetical protein ABIJ18_03250 [archaeon]
MTNTLKPLNLGRRILTEEEVLEQLAGYQPTNPRQEPEPTPQPQPTREPEQEADIIPQDYILLESTGNYPDTHISTTRIHQGNNWFQAHEELHKEGLYMPTLRQFVDFLKLLKGGKAFNGQGNKIPKNQLEQILKEIIEVRAPGRAEWLDADFKVKSDILHINYNHRTVGGQLQPNQSEVLQPYLDQNKTPGIGLEYWLNNATSRHGLPPANTSDGSLYYWAPMSDNNSVARFDAYSGRASLSCDGNPRDSNSSLGVRPCARKN